MNNQPWSFAELGMGGALGGLPNKTRLLVRSPSNKKRTTIIVKNDIGGGGSSVNGYPRTIDLYAPVALSFFGADCNWTGLIEWHRF